LEKQVSWWAAGLLALIIGLLLLREGSRLPLFLQQAGVATVLLNGLAMGGGWLLAKLLRLPLPQQICLAVEVGIQNGTLAIALTAGLLQRPALAIPAAVYSLVMYVTGGLAIYLGRRGASA
jgi:BASS family bile acid:Na+ symporter